MHHLLERHSLNGLCFDGWARASYSAGDEFSVYVIRLDKGHQYSHLSAPSNQLAGDTRLPRALLLIASTTSSSLVGVASTWAAPDSKARSMMEGAETLLSANTTTSPCCVLNSRIAAIIPSRSDRERPTSATSMLWSRLASAISASEPACEITSMSDSLSNTQAIASRIALCPINRKRRFAATLSSMKGLRPGPTDDAHKDGRVATILPHY